jgi:ligand-binding sensor domain-containing protein
VSLFKSIPIVLLFLLVLKNGQAQSPVFYHLSTAEGLTDNNVSSAAIDRNGILWIGTTEGLNSFDGNRIQLYHKHNQPAMPDNYVEDIIIDNSNNLWLKISSPHVTMVDRNRNFHLLKLDDSSSRVVNELFATSIGMVAMKGNQHYTCKDPATGRFEKMNFPFQHILPARTVFITPLSGDRIAYYGNDRLLLVDFSKMKLLLDMKIEGLLEAVSINDDEILAYTTRGDVFYRISISQKKVIKEYRDLRDQQGKVIEGNLRSIARVNENRFAITTRFSGLYFLNLDKITLEHYTHDPLDQRSIGGNNTFRIRYDSSGYLMVTTQTSGLHYYNVKKQQASFKPYFKDNKAEVFDGYIQTILATKDSVVWMGAQDRLVRWDRKNDRSDFIPCYLPNGTNISGEETIRALQFDQAGNLWVGTTRFGILVLDKNYKTIKQLTYRSDSTTPSVPSPWINAICDDQSGNTWVATFRGICKVNKNGFTVQSLEDHPVLGPVSKIHCIKLWVDQTNRVWMGTRSGVYCYDEKNKLLQYFSTKNGLPHNVVYAINEVNYGNIYFGTSGGLSILSQDGSIKTFNRSNGLKNDKCEGILKDENGFLWIGNLSCILRYDPVNKKFAVFEEGYGFSHAGFRMRSCFKSPTGEMFWGSDKGLTWFFPNQMNTETLPLHPAIHALQTPDTTYRFTGNNELSFPYNTSSLAFYFSSGVLTGGKKSQILYRLSGFDKTWQEPAANGQVVYSRLPSGKYKFEIKASPDGASWYEAEYPVVIGIKKPWWNQTWFRLLYISLAAGIIIFSYLYFKKRKEDRVARLKSKMEIMELNVKMAESRFSNLRLQMNPHFLFNSLSSIQHLIVSQQTTKAYKYLTLFSNFLRSLLNFADKNFIPLDEELKILKMYVELESLRFDQSFSYEITVDETLANDEILLPTLMVQPFAENAIWHGLLHKEGDKKLSIRFSNNSEEFLTCVIEDNGVGRLKSAEIQKNKISSATHTSKGIGIIRERLTLMEQKTGKPASVEVTDKTNEAHQAVGTKVTITIPYYNPEAS